MQWRLRVSLVGRASDSLDSQRLDAGALCHRVAQHPEVFHHFLPGALSLTKLSVRSIWKQYAFMEPSIRKRKLLIGIAAILLFALSLQVMGGIPLGSGYPTAWTPMPALLFIPMFLLLLVHPTGAMLLSVGFYFWCRPLPSSPTMVPKRTFWAFLVVAVASVAWFLSSYDYGVRWEGIQYTNLMIRLDLISAAVVGACLLLARRARLFSVVLIANFLIFAWALTYAFPSLGEMP